MAVPILNYSTPRDAQSRWGKLPEILWWLLGAVYSFSGIAGIMRALAHSSKKGFTEINQLCNWIGLFFSGLFLLLLIERIVRKRIVRKGHNLSPFARGAFIGSLVLGGLILVASFAT